MGASTKYESEEKNRSFNVNTSLTLHNETKKKRLSKSFSNLLGPVVDGTFCRTLNRAVPVKKREKRRTYRSWSCRVCVDGLVSSAFCDLVGLVAPNECPGFGRV